MALPIIYVFCNSKGCTGRGDWHNGIAVAEDGTALAGHVSSNHEFIKADLGNHRLGYRGFVRNEYDKHYPDGYEVKWIEGDEITRVVATFPPQPQADPPRAEP